MHLRWLIRHDMPRVLAIERAAFEFPWTAQEFVRHLRQRNMIGMVAELDHRVAGYMLYELERQQIRLVNLAVDPTAQRRGFGTALVAHLLKKLSPGRRPRLVTAVRETNLPAQQFFRACGLRAIGVWRSCYADVPGEDAYVFEWRAEWFPPAFAAEKNRISEIPF